MKFFLVIVLMMSQGWIYSQPFTKVFSRGDDLLQLHVLETYPDNGWIASGSIRVGNENSSIISRFDALGNKLWTKSPEYARDPKAIVTLNNGDLLVFYNNFGLNQYFDASVLHLDPDGNFKNEVVWGTPDDQDDWFDAQKTQDGGVIAVGMSRPSLDFIQNVMVVRFSASGQVLWEKMYRGTEILGFNKVVPIPTGGFFLLGNLYNVTDPGVLIARCNEEGTLLWSKKFIRGNEYEFLFDGVSLNNEDVMVATYISDSVVAGQIILTRFDGNGAIIGQTMVSNGLGMSPIGIGWIGSDTLALAAVSSPVLFPPVDSDLILATFTKEGNLIGNIAFGSDKQDFGIDAIFRNGEAIFCGLTDSSATGIGQRAFLSKANPRFSCCRKSTQLNQMPPMNSLIAVDYPLIPTQNTIKQQLSVSMTDIQLVESISCQSLEETDFLPQDTSICIGEEIEIFPKFNIPGEFLWSTGANTSSIFVTEPGTYSLQINSECGLNTDTIMVGSKGSIPILMASSDTSICSGTSARLFASGGNSYSWKDVNGTILSNTAELQTAPDSSMIFSVIVANGACFDTAFVSVTVRTPPVVVLSLKDTLVSQGVSLTLAAAGAVSYFWEPVTGLSCSDCPSPQLTAEETAVYVVTGIDSSGCWGIDSVVVRVKKPCPIFIPTIFAPGENTGFENDIFRVYASDISTEGFLLQVYSRWGELVFQTQDPYSFWDGKYRGRPASAGVYTYQVEMITCEGIVRKVGDITLVR